jgi:hypothetical protein
VGAEHNDDPDDEPLLEDEDDGGDDKADKASFAAELKQLGQQAQEFADA